MDEGLHESRTEKAYIAKEREENTKRVNGPERTSNIGSGNTLEGRLPGTYLGKGNEIRKKVIIW